MTSRKTSFLRYLIPSLRHETALVTAIGGRAWISSLWDSCVMYLQIGVSVGKIAWKQESALLKDFVLRGLGIAEVHHFIQQFVDDYEVIPYTLFLELFEILGEDLHDFVKEEENLGGIGIAFRQSEQVEVVVSNVEVLLLL